MPSTIVCQLYMHINLNENIYRKVGPQWNVTSGKWTAGRRIPNVRACTWTTTTISVDSNKYT